MKPQHVMGSRWRRMLGAFVVCACVAPLVACGLSSVQGTSGSSGTSSTASTASTTGTPGASSYGTLEGDVVAAPTCPVESSVNPCQPRPVTYRSVAIVGAINQTIAKTTTDQLGHFSLKLPPGTYTIRVAIMPGTVGIRQVTPAKVTIIAGQTTHITLVLDTGIR